MSLLSDLGLTREDLQDVSPPLRDQIVRQAMRDASLKELTALQAMRKGTKRLNDTARAVRKKQGLDMPDDPDDEIVQGDKITNNVGMLPAILGGGGIAAAILAAAWMLKPAGPPTVAPENPPAVVDTDTSLQIDGELVDETPPPITPP